MIYRISIILLLGGLLWSCNKSKQSNGRGVSDNEIEEKTYYSTQHLIEVEKLVDILEHENLKIIDFRKSEAYAKDHIPGAINIWRTDLEDPVYPYKGMMVTKKQIEQLFSKLGIRNEDLLVVYDDLGACDAARLWWILKNYDFESVKLVNGGLSAWKSYGGSTDSKTPVPTRSVFTLPNTKSFTLWIGKNELIPIVQSKGEEIILDTRSKEEFNGKRQKSGAYKSGRIPKSMLIDWAEAIDFNNYQKFRSAEELERLYNQMGVTKNNPIITYCHSGVRSAHTTFVLTELLGYQNVRNYDGSWVEWSYFDELPTERDFKTKIKKI